MPDTRPMPDTDNLDVEVMPDVLWLSVRGPDDLQVIRMRDGHTELAINTTPETLRLVAQHILKRLHQYEAER